MGEERKKLHPPRPEMEIHWYRVLKAHTEDLHVYQSCLGGGSGGAGAGAGGLGDGGCPHLTITVQEEAVYSQYPAGFSCCKRKLPAAWLK